MMIGSKQQELTMQAHQYAALVQLGEAALASTDVLALMRHAGGLVARTLAIEYSRIMELLTDGSALVVRSGVGWEERVVEQVLVPVDASTPAGYALLSGGPVIVENWSEEPRFSQPALLRQHRVASSLRVPIQGKSRPLGVLGVDSTLPRPFADDDVQFVQAVANLLAMAIERIQAEESLRAGEARFRRLAENAADIIYHYHFAPTPGFDYVSPASTAITGYTPADYYTDPELGLRLAHPADRPLLEATMRSTSAIGMPLTVRLIRRDGRQIWTEQRISPVFDAAGQLVGVEGIVRDVTGRVHDYQTLEQRVEERTREIEGRRKVAEGLREILTILNSHRPLDEILGHIIAQACQLLGTAVGGIYRLDHQTGVLTIRASRGLDPDDAAMNLPAGWGPISQAVLERRAVPVADTALCSSCEDSLSATQPGRLDQLLRRYRALLIAPLIVKDDIYGAMALYYYDPRPFSDEEILLAGAVSDQAALAIENARLVAAAQGRAVLEERQRLARDLHDSVTQALYGVTLYAEAGARIAATGDAATVVSHLRELQEMAQAALQEMRLLIFELRPPVLEEAGLRAALQTRLEAVEGRSKLNTRLIAEETGSLPAAVEQALYRIAQESLNNVLKHARAQSVTVGLRREGQTVILEITDDGIGFEPSAARDQGGLGLLGIAERVAQIGGRLSLRSTPGAGTRVRVEVSL